jgi:glycosyltransferase involved in cell wall biosynthesis
MDAHDLVTVVIPARNEAASIGACLDSVRAQTHRDLQVVVVDGASEDTTVEVVRTHMASDPRIELLHHQALTIPSSLNQAVRAARGRWLVRVDAHSTVGPDYVALAVERLRAGWGGVGGRKEAVARTSAGRAIAVALGSRLGVGGSTYHYGTAEEDVDHIPFGAYPLDVVRELGGWDETLVANEDYEFDYRVRETGRRLLFDPRLVIRWHCRETVPDLYRQYRRYGSGKADVVRLHPTSLSPRHLMPPAFVAYLAAGALLGVRHPQRLLVMLAPYAAGVAAESVRCAPRLAPQDRRHLPAAFVAMHVGWGVGFWQRVLTRRRGPVRAT